jgi:copper chaperone
MPPLWHYPAMITPVETRIIAVDGMSCDHCADAIKTEIGKLPGVTGIDVDVAAGKATITAGPFPSDFELRAAVGEAGYQITS